MLVSQHMICLVHHELLLLHVLLMPMCAIQNWRLEDKNLLNFVTRVFHFLWNEIFGDGRVPRIIICGRFENCCCNMV